VPRFAHVDVVEGDARFAAAVESHVQSQRLGRVYCAPLQVFVPERGRYDVIWAQWALNYLTDGVLTVVVCVCVVVVVC